MSSVTNTILAFSIMEDVKERFDDVNRFFGDHAGFMWTWEKYQGECSCVGGSKSLEQPTFIAAFNYLDEQGLLRHMRTLPWVEPENVQLIVARQDDDRYEIITLQ